MGSKSYRASDHKEWDAAGLDAIQERHEMKYCNQEEDGFDQLRGEWSITDDATMTIIYGTFGNYNSPGASHYTYAEVYDDREEYQAAVKEWDDKSEYLERDDDEEGEDESE